MSPQQRLSRRQEEQFLRAHFPDYEPRYHDAFLYAPLAREGESSAGRVPAALWPGNAEIR
jgi:hypothetical protein